MNVVHRHGTNSDRFHDHGYAIVVSHLPIEARGEIVAQDVHGFKYLFTLTFVGNTKHKIVPGK